MRRAEYLVTGTQDEARQMERESPWFRRIQSETIWLQPARARSNGPTGGSFTR